MRITRVTKQTDQPSQVDNMVENENRPNINDLKEFPVLGKEINVKKKEATIDESLICDDAEMMTDDGINYENVDCDKENVVVLKSVDKIDGDKNVVCEKENVNVKELMNMINVLSRKVELLSLENQGLKKKEPSVKTGGGNVKLSDVGGIPTYHTDRSTLTVWVMTVHDILYSLNREADIGIFRSWLKASIVSW